MYKKRLKNLYSKLTSSFLIEEKSGRWFLVKWCKLGSSSPDIKFEISSELSKILFKNGVFTTVRCGYGYKEIFHPFRKNNKLMSFSLMSDKSRVSKEFYKSNDYKNIQFILKEFSPLLRESLIDKIIESQK